MTNKKDRQVVHVAPGGYRFYLKALPPGVFMVVASQDDKPRPPEKEVEYIGGTIVTEPDPNDKDYKDQVAAWQMQYNSRLFRTCLVHGVDRVEKGGKPAGPSAEEIATIRLINQNAKEKEIYIHWYAQILANTTMGFMNLVLGQTEPTEAGIAESEAAFRPDGDGAGDPGEDN